MENIIKYPLDEEEKQQFRDRLENVLSATTGSQAIILIGNGKLLDYYQNICVPHLIGKLVDSVNDYSLKTQQRLVKLTSDK